MPMKIDGMTPHGASVTMAHDHDEKTQGTDADFGAELFDQQDSFSTEQLEKMLASGKVFDFRPYAHADV